MKVENIRELPDGGATLDIELTEEESNSLLNYAVNQILRGRINAERTKRLKELVGELRSVVANNDAPHSISTDDAELIADAITTALAMKDIGV